MSTLSPISISSFHSSSLYLRSCSHLCSLLLNSASINSSLILCCCSHFFSLSSIYFFIEDNIFMIFFISCVALGALYWFRKVFPYMRRRLKYWTYSTLNLIFNWQLGLLWNLLHPYLLIFFFLRLLYNFYHLHFLSFLLFGPLITHITVKGETLGHVSSSTHIPFTPART